MRRSPTVNVDRLKPSFEPAGASPAPGPASDAGQEGEREVELLLNRRTVRGVTRYLVRWRGHASVDNEWLLLEELAHCPEKVAEYAAAAPRRAAAAASRAGPGPRWTGGSPRCSFSAGAAGGTNVQCTLVLHPIQTMKIEAVEQDS